MSGYQQNMLKCNRKKLSSKVEYVTREATVITDHLNVMLSKLQQRTKAILNDDDVHFSAHFEEVNEELERALEKVFLLQTTIDSFAQENVTPVNETIDNNIDNFSVNSVNSPDVTFSDQRSPLTDLSNPESVSELNIGLPDISLEPSPALAIVEVPTGKCDHERIQSTFLQSNIPLEDFGNSYCKPSCAASAVGIRETQYSSLECLPAERQVSLNFESRTVLTSQHSLLQNVSHNYSNENVTEGSDIGNCKKNVAHKKEFVGWNCSDDFVEVYNSRKPNSIPEPNIMLGEQTTASITRFINPSDFWMQIKNFTTKKLCPISISLCSLPDERSSKFLFKKNGFCLAPFNQQGHWYRAKILSSLEPEENDVHVFYIDQGSEGCVPLLQLRLLPKQLYSYPALAIHCFIHGVLPVNGTWSIEAITEFEETYTHSTIEPYIFSKVGDKYPVRFSVTAKVTGEDFTYDMAEMLISFKFGVLENGKEGDFKSIQPSFSVESSNSAVLTENSILDKDNNFVTELLSTPENQNHCTVGNIKIKCEGNKSTLHEQLPISKSTLEYNDNLNMEICSEKNERIYSEHYQIEGNTDEVCFLEHDASNESKAFEAYESITCSAQQMENNTDLDCKKNVSIVSCLTNDYDWNAVVPVLNFDYTKGDKLIVMMSNVSSPSELYVHCESKNIEDFDDLQDQLSSVYNSCSSSDFVYPNDGLKPNMFCCCCYSVDKNWYRAKILKECNPKEKCVIENSACIHFHVQYIDYGNMDIVNIQHIRPLFKKFIEYPTFVICCALAGIKPKSEGAETKMLDYAVNECNYIWSKDAIQKFKMLVTVEKIYTAEVVTSGKYHESYVVPICLWDTDSIKDILINRVLVEQSIAEVLDSSSNFILSENKDCDYFNDPMSEDYYSPLNSYGVNLEDVEIATIGYKAKDEKYICKFFSQFGKCYKSDKCSYQHVKVCRGQTQDKKSIDFLGESILLPEISDYLLVSVSAVFNPGHFFVVFPYGNKPVNKLFKSDVYASNYKEAEDLSILMERMREHYNKAFFVDSTTVALACGDLVAAKSKVDGNWCRARVIEIFDVAAPVQVFLVDFGSCELVERTNIRYLELEYRHLPFQAVECHLINVMPPDCSSTFKWNEESRIKFLELVEGKILLAHVTNIIGSVVFLELFSTSEKELCNIGKCLIESGCAQHAEIFLGSSCRYQITDSNCGNHVLLPG